MKWESFNGSHLILRHIRCNLLEHGQRPKRYHEKHRPPAGATRAGVNGDGVPDSIRHLFNQARLEIERPTAGKAAAGDSTQAGARQARTLPTEGRQAAGITPRRNDR